MFRDMAIDAGAQGYEIDQMAQFLEQQYQAEQEKWEYNLLGEMQYRGINIHCLPPVIEETPDTSA